MREQRLIAPRSIDKPGPQGKQQGDGKKNLVRKSTGIHPQDHGSHPESEKGREQERYLHAGLKEILHHTQMMWMPCVYVWTKIYRATSIPIEDVRRAT
jgi:hypothetical protein